MANLIDKTKELLGFGPKQDVVSNPMNPQRFTPVKFTVYDEGTLVNNPTALDTFGRLSQISALGDATKGLQAIAQIGAVGGAPAQKLINGGTDAVLNTVLSPAGISANDVHTSISKVSPSAVNTSISHSQDILDKVKNGEFTVDSIPEYTRDFANLIKIGKSILSPFYNQQQVVQKVPSHTNYVSDIIDIFGGVKFNYRYMVQFVYRPEYENLNGLATSYLVKSCDRPQVEFDTEDVNMYNFRTKVIKKTTFQPISMKFYDDQLSHVLGFFTSYLNIVSPITNLNSKQSDEFEINGLFNIQQAVATNTLNGLGGSTDKGGTLKLEKNAVWGYAASLGAFASTTVSQSILKSIRVYHFYQGGSFCDIYEITNPKVTNIQMDELNNTGGSEGNTLTATFAYDNFKIQPFVQVGLIAPEIHSLLMNASSTKGLIHAKVDEANLKLPTSGSTLATEHTTLDTQAGSGEVKQGAASGSIPNIATKESRAQSVINDMKERFGGGVEAPVKIPGPEGF